MCTKRFISVYNKFIRGVQKVNRIGLDELRQIIKSFLETPKVNETIEFEEPLRISKAEMYELIKAFGKPLRSIETSHFDIWTDVIDYGFALVVIKYEDPEDGTYLLHSIAMVKRGESA